MEALHKLKTGVEPLFGIKQDHFLQRTHRSKSGVTVVKNSVPKNRG